MSKGVTVLAFLVAALVPAQAFAQGLEGPPHAGYVFPSGGRQGTAFEVKVGGEYLFGVTDAVISGEGVDVEVLDSEAPPDILDIRKRNKQRKTVLGEVITLRVTIAADAEPGDRDFCVVAPGGVSNKLVFQVGQLPEVVEEEPRPPWAKGAMKDRPPAYGAPPAPGAGIPFKDMPLPALPVTVNGQIMPGDIDTFRFSAKKGQQLVFEVSARRLIPYLADSVPGWFQAVLELRDAKKQRVAYVDDFRFDPDPVLFYDVPADGDYTLEIRDSIYRGRGDFVYRIRIGELPFITHVFPLGARRGSGKAQVRLYGKNLPEDRISVPMGDDAPPLRNISVLCDGMASNRVRFAGGRLPEVTEREMDKPTAVKTPVTVNGRIDGPGDRDVFTFRGKKDQTIRVEVRARRLGSPLDSCVIVRNARGEKIAENDDVKDATEGLLTHVADSELTVKLKEEGEHSVEIRDCQGKGGEEYAYRLRIGAPAPDFELSVSPARVRLFRGGSAGMTVRADRSDGFDGAIKLALEGAPKDVKLDTDVIPAGAEKVGVTVTVSESARTGVVAPRIVGTAVIDGEKISRVAAPVDEQMQAFLYMHWVPSEESSWVVDEGEAPFTIALAMPKQNRYDLPVGRKIPFRVSVSRGEGFDGPCRLSLVDPPEGIKLLRGGVGQGRDVGGGMLEINEKVELGTMGSLVFEATMVVIEEVEYVESKELQAQKAALAKRAKGKEEEKAEKDEKAGGKRQKNADGKVMVKRRKTVTAACPAVAFRTVEPPKKAQPAPRRARRRK